MRAGMAQVSGRDGDECEQCAELWCVYHALDEDSRAASKIGADKGL